MQATNETNEYYCVNCGSPLHEFVPSDRQGIYGYCRDVNCHYSSLYDPNYEIARMYFINHGENIDDFRFYDGEKTIEDVETIKSTTYTTCLKF